MRWSYGRAWWKALRLLEDGGVVLEKPVEHGPLSGGGRDCRRRPRCGQARGVVPHVWSPVALEVECLCVEVPGDGTQRAQEVYVEDEVEAAQMPTHVM
jgi:hypothetical protein